MQHVIRNFDELAVNTERADALAIAEAGYAAVDTGAALARKLRIAPAATAGEEVLHIDSVEHKLTGRRIFFVGIGKCAIVAAKAVETIFGDRLTAGIALDVSPIEHALKKIETFVGTHPLPSDTNERATERIVAMLSDCREDDLVIMLISGGGSTLLCLHEKPMTCLEEADLFTALTARGATIQDINVIRKHVSLARGGGLAKAAYPAEVVSFIVSDVPGNDIEYIASGPTVLDSSTVADAQSILELYAIDISAPISFIETPKEEKYFERVTNILLITNQDALRAMRDEAVRRGYSAAIMGDHFSGEASDIGHNVLETLHASPARTVLLYAGETTVSLGTHKGIGGRNQEMALAALGHLLPGELLLPFASDGRDDTDHAGAIADALTLEHATTHNLSIETHLADHDSYPFFSTTGDGLSTGYTGSNVSDLIIAIKN